MYERDKNHPSILIWSCGNESSQKRILSPFKHIILSFNSKVRNPTFVSAISINERKTKEDKVPYLLLYLKDKKEELVWESKIEILDEKIEIQAELPEVFPWSAESPYLYQLIAIR